MKTDCLPIKLSRVLLVAAAAICILSGTRGVVAAEIIFTIDPNQSSLTWSGSDNVYGAFVPQSPGSLVSSVSGHFLVKFDPTTATPATIQFVGGHGYYEVASNTSTGSPGSGLSSTPSPANFAGRTLGGEVNFAIRDLVWDFSSGELPLSSGGVSATQTPFTVTNGRLEAIHPTATSVAEYAGPDQYNPTAGDWSLAQTGSGDWTLSLNGSYTYGYRLHAATLGTMTGSAVAVSTAHFGPENMATVPQQTAGAEVPVLGGAGVTGGVTVGFGAGATGGALSVQQVPNNTALSQAAVDAGAANPIFALSTGDLSVAPQIWNVEFGGSLNGGTATIVFHYNPALLPVGLDESTLGIWHFNSISGQWEFGGTVNTADDTITFVTNSFSPFELGVQVPEPSTFVLAGLALAALLLGGRRASKRSRAAVVS